MRITFYSKQLTSISICDNINKLESGLFASPTTCIYFILGRTCMAETSWVYYKRRKGVYSFQNQQIDWRRRNTVRRLIF